MLAPDIAHRRAKCDHSRFSRSGDMVGVYQNLNGSCDMTTPLSGIVCHLWAIALATINLSVPNLKSLFLPTTNIRNAIQNNENRVVWGSWGSRKVTGNSAIH